MIKGGLEGRVAGLRCRQASQKHRDAELHPSQCRSCPLVLHSHQQQGGGVRLQFLHSEAANKHHYFDVCFFSFNFRVHWSTSIITPQKSTEDLRETGSHQAPCVPLRLCCRAEPEPSAAASRTGAEPDWESLDSQSL